MYKGERLGIVGECGWGKWRLGGRMIGLYEGREGEIVFKGEDMCDVCE
ncbi:hypothetical protein [Bacillus altitudinis]